MPFALRLIPAAAAACVIAACGGGEALAPPDVQTPAASTRGVAVDGYLNGATALCDSNGNGLADSGEITATTTVNGVYTFSASCSAVVVVTGGTNVDTGLPFKGVLKAPAGASVASPLTTLIVAGMSQAQVLATLGLPSGTDLLNTDPALRSNGNLVNADLFKKTLAVQQLLQQTTEVFAGLAASSAPGTLQQIYQEVTTAFSVLLKGSGPINSGTTINSSLVANLVQVAANQVSTSTIVPAVVRNAVAALNAEALGVVTAGSLKLQAEAFLKAADADLVAVTTARQADTSISTFVAANSTQLTAAPTAATTTLGSTLTQQVAGGSSTGGGSTGGGSTGGGSTGGGSTGGGGTGGGSTGGDTGGTPGGNTGGTPVATNYLALAGNALTLVNGSAATSYTVAQFQSDAGINLSWPLPSPMVLRVAVAEAGSAALADGQKLSAAVAITETTASGKGELRGYISNVSVSKTAQGLKIEVPTSGAEALVYGVSGDARKKAVIDFAGSVAGVQNTLRTAASSVNNIVFGSVVNYAINQVSNDFTGIYSLRGKYKLSIVINGLPLRQADGSALPEVSITVPTALNVTGATTASKTVTGPGLVGFITLTD